MDPLKELEGLDAGRQLALVKKLGGRDVVNAILRGEVAVNIKEVIKKLFDKHGRRIPENLQANVFDPNRKFKLNQPRITEEVEFANRIIRLHGSLGIDTGITAEQLLEETGRLLAMIGTNPQIANITNGVLLPIILPQLKTDDLGTALEQYVEAMGKSYAKTFDDRKFYNHREGTLAGEVSIVAGSRHEQLISRMKEGPVIGIHLPNSLQGFSINADREQIATLPEGFVLSGLDTIIAATMYPDILARDYNTPGYDLAAISWQSAGCSLSLGANDDGLDFGGTASLSFAFGRCSGGLFFLG